MSPFRKSATDIFDTIKLNLEVSKNTIKFKTLNVERLVLLQLLVT